MELALGLSPVPSDRRPLPVSAADSINHEFRTPLATLMGHLELIRERSAELPPDVASSLDTMQRAGERLSVLVAAYADIAEVTEHSYFPG